jgi:coenzyme F420-reducing hydrogenase beta subunit
MEAKMIVEITPIQVKKILEEHLTKEGFKVKKIKFSTGGIIAYVTESVQKNKGKKKKPRYENEKFSDIGCNTKICNCLMSVKVETIRQLEVYLTEQISLHLEWTSKDALLYIRGMGNGSYRELINILELKNLQIKDNGKILLVS